MKLSWGKNCNETSILLAFMDPKLKPLDTYLVFFFQVLGSKIKNKNWVEV